MFTLDKIAPLVKKRKRIGRGGSRGGTSGKGHKGQKARSGGKIRRGFEGGQMPLYRRLPKQGFSNEPHALVIEIVNIGRLNELFENGSEVTKEILVNKGEINPREGKPFLLKVLGNGALEKKLTVVADMFSASAQAAIEKIGGKAHVTPKE